MTPLAAQNFPLGLAPGRLRVRSSYPNTDLRDYDYLFPRFISCGHVEAKRLPLVLHRHRHFRGSLAAATLKYVRLFGAPQVGLTQRLVDGARHILESLRPPYGANRMNDAVACLRCDLGNKRDDPSSSFRRQIRPGVDDSGEVDWHRVAVVSAAARR